MELTPSQNAVLAYVQDCMATGKRGFVYWMGGVRSGKSHGSCIALMEHLAHRQNRVYMVLAYTAKQALTIFGGTIESLAEERGMECKVLRGMSNPHIRFPESGNEVLFRGADKEGRDRAIQGLTLSGLIVDEVPNLHRATLHQAEARVSDPGGLRIYTSNKTTPYHWTTKYYHDRLQAGSLDGLLVDSAVADNPHVDAAYREERANEYEGNTLKRFMDNEFTLDAPAIYQPGKSNQGRGMPGYVAIFGHDSGYEVITASWRQGVLHVLSGDSYGAYQDVPELEFKDPVFLVNDAQTILARHLRSQGKTVRGYMGFFHPLYMEVLKQACRDGLLAVNQGASDLWEAVDSYATAGCYDYPIMQAFEALAHPLKNHVS